VKSPWIERLADVADAAALLGGLAYYRLRGQTPERAYQGMVRLFTRSGGRTNDLLSRGVSALRKPEALAAHDGVLGALTDAKRRTITESLDRDGYYVFDERLPDPICDRLLALAERTPANAQGAGEATPGTDGDAMLVIDRATPRAVRYELTPADLVADSDVQALMADWSLLTVAQDYLRAAPVMDIVTMWWHTAFKDAPDARAAQFYHFDMDRPRWLKFFFYLTDVGPENGPHCFIRGSHRTGGIKPELLSRGYARLTDEDVAQHYAPDDHIRFTGRRGTIIAEDTRGLHKGQHVGQGDRLIFQLELTNTLFGGKLTRTRIRPPVVPELRDRVLVYPRIYSAFDTHEID
jgi:ectoine hydroxylase-related dioxygenase (phytanoyl-CoA dioxygenase family)